MKIKPIFDNSSITLWLEGETSFEEAFLQMIRFEGNIDINDETFGIVIDFNKPIPNGMGKEKKCVYRIMQNDNREEE